MNPTKATGATALIFGTFLIAMMTSAPSGQAPAAPPAPAQAPAAPAGPGAAGAQAPGGAQGGRAGGRGNPAATLFTDQCAGCHGNDLAGGRAPTLFDQKWLATMTDESLIKSIKGGVPNTEMEPFGKALDDAQIWSLVSYIRTQTGTLRPRPAFVENPHGVVLATEKQKVRVDVLTSDLNTPFGLAFLPDGRLLITERPGRLRVFANGKLSEPVKGIPTVHAVQDGGLLDVEVHPQYARNGFIYLAYTEVQPGFVPPPPAAPAAAPAPAPAAPTVPAPAPGVQGGPAPAPAAAPVPGRGARGPQIPGMTVIVRGKLTAANEWVQDKVIFRAAPELYTPSGSHYGLRFTFDREGHLFYSIGERGNMANAQDLKNPLGKIHRVNDDGTVPKDNPFIGTPGAVPTIWSYGHRNPQGLAWDPITGKLWESEHGPNSADEINLIEKGHNYGWGVATKSVQAGMVSSAPGMDDPIIYYTPTMATAGIAFYTGNRYPGWKNTSLFVGGLVGQRLERLEITKDKVTKQEVLFETFGRVRDIIQGPDGYFYVIIQNPTGGTSGVALSAATPGKLVRLMPVP